MAYIGREPQIGNYQICDAISVVNAQAAYTMQVSSVNVIPESVNHMIVSLNGVIQKPGSSYTISSSTITFSSNLATGDSIDFIYLLGNVLDLGTPSDDTVTGAKIVDNAINSEHYTDGSIDLAHLSADSVDGSKIADDAINSEHYTDGSIDTAHIADGQVTTAKLATAVFTGATDIGADIADADLFLMDDGAGGTIRKTAASRIKTYASGLTGVTTGSGNVTITDGNLVVASGHGVDFAATGDIGGTGSELLDDYEEGTFTPTFVNQSGGEASNYTNNSSGQYIKIGTMVWVNVSWSMGTISTGPGSIYAGIGGFPFVADGSAGGSPWYTNIDVPNGHATFQISNNYNYGIFYSQRDNQNYNTIGPGAISSSDNFYITFCYKTD